MIDPAGVATASIAWKGARRVIRSIHPPIDLFEDVADPEDWPLLISAEMKTNPRLAASIGKLDLVPPARRVAGPGASYLMAPFTHASPDRPSRFGNGSFGVLYAGDRFEVALLETVHHHARFMRATREAAGWTSQFRELILDVMAVLHDLRPVGSRYAPALDPDDHAAGQRLGKILRDAGSDGLVYPSVRCEGGECVALFYPDLARNLIQGRHIDYHWDGARVDLFRDVGSRQIYRIG